MTSFRPQRQLPYLCGLVLFALIAWLTEFLLQTQQHSAEMSRQIDLRTDLYSVREKIDRSLAGILNGSVGVAAYIQVKSGQLEEDEIVTLLKTLHGNSKHVKNYDLAEGTVLKYIYPLTGNEEVLGLNFKTVPEQWPEVFAAMNSSEGILSEPTELLQGGHAFIFRMPIAVDGEYWGIFSTVVHADSFLRDIASNRMFAKGDLAIRSAGHENQKVLVGNELIFSNPDAQRVDVAVPGGHWQLAMVAKDASNEAFDTTWRLLGWVVAALLGIGLGVILMQRAALKDLVLVDDLTGLANRRQFDLMLERFCQKYNRRNSGSFAILYLDLDRFKAINDNHGHRVGDFFLIELAARAGQAIRGGDLLARWGGDEFAIILDNPTQSNIDDVVTRVRALVEQPVQWRMEQLQVGVSIGVVQYPDDGLTPEALVAAADQKMYAEKYVRHDAEQG